MTSETSAGETTGRTKRETTLPGVGQRRNDPRLKLSADVLVTPLDVDIPPFWATTEDISHTGVFVNAAMLLPIDCEVLLTLAIHGRGDLVLEGEARVVHCISGAGFGCRFIERSSYFARQISELTSYASSAPRAARTLSSGA